MKDETPDIRSTSIWRGGAAFEHQGPSGVHYRTDAVLKNDGGAPATGPTPMEAQLGVLAGCFGVDFASMLPKMRLEVESIRIEVSARRAPEHPRVYTTLHVDVHLETRPHDARRALRALGLCLGKYCSVSAMLSAGGTALTYTLHYAGEEHEGTVQHAPPAG